MFHCLLSFQEADLDADLEKRTAGMCSCFLNKYFVDELDELNI